MATVRHDHDVNVAAAVHRSLLTLMESVAFNGRMHI